MASSHREHGQEDCLVLSCRQCELSSRQSQTVFNILETGQFCLVCSVKYENKTRLSSHRISRLDKTVSKFLVADSLDLSPIQFTPLTWTRLDKVSSCILVNSVLLGG